MVDPPHTDDRRETDLQPAPNAVKRTASNRLEVLRTVGQLGSLGMSFALAVVMGAGLGAWLDKLTGWRPVMFIVFFFLGLAAGILNVVRILKLMK